MSVPNISTPSNITQTSFTAGWSAVGTPLQTVSYRLDVSENQNFTSFLSGFNNRSVNSTSQTVTGLRAGTAYFYRVRSVINGTTSANSNTASATTAPPNAEVTDQSLNLSALNLDSLGGALEKVDELATSLLSPPSGSIFASITDPALLDRIANPSTVLQTDARGAIDQVVKLATDGKGIDLSSVNSLMDCVKNLEDRIKKAGINLLINLILAQPFAAGLLLTYQKVILYQNLIVNIINTIKNADPRTLAIALVGAALSQTPLAKSEAIQKIRQEFGDKVDNLNEILDKLNDINICEIPNINIFGQKIPNPVLMSAKSPVRSPLPQGAIINQARDSTSARYNDIMFNVKGYTGKEANPNSSLSVLSTVNTIVFAYHNKIYNSTDDSNDQRFFEEYRQSIKIEEEKNKNRWNTIEMQDFLNRASGAGEVLKGNTNQIREYVMSKNPSILSGSFIARGVTVYGGVMTDLTTFLEVKREQRPAEAVAKWSAKVNIAEQERRLIARGLRVSYIPLSWATSTAYEGTGGMISDKTCASTRVPGGSILALKNPDGTPYDPTGRNPEGTYRVTDTGNAKLTYDKVDIYTETPDIYKKTNMNAVQVFVVSLGTKKGKQYNIAQSRYGGGSATTA